VLSRPRVLVADDDSLVREQVARALRAGYEILHAADGDETLRKAREAAPDLLLLDLRMPRMDGYTVCRALKADVDTQGMPIIMLTGLGDTAEKVRGIELGADDYITKPFDADELRARVQMVLRRTYS
jgi:DNA-binding response OmpR family regulator